MADMDLLKIARSRDDTNLGWRVTAALTLHAQYNADSEGDTPAGAALTEWVLANPMVPDSMMTAFVTTAPEVLTKVTLEHGTIDTSGVLDADIRYVVGAKWPLVAARRFPNA